jgi:hypothetical protein
MTFCCYAELIWPLLAKPEAGGEGKTQQAVADELGLSRDKVNLYSRLRQIDEKARQIVATAVRDFGLGQPIDDVASYATTVAPFTEGFLRVLPPLLADQQHELCRPLSRGKDAKGHKFDKADFTLQAQRYRALNALRGAGEAIIRDAVPEGGQRDGYLEAFSKEVERPIFMDEYFREAHPPTAGVHRERARFSAPMTPP